jgi:hypothetical protein
MRHRATVTGLTRSSAAASIVVRKTACVPLVGAEGRKRPALAAVNRGRAVRDLADCNIESVDPQSAINSIVSAPVKLPGGFTGTDPSHCTTCRLN